MKAYGWCGLLLLLVSEYGLFHKIDPFYSWFYCFVWWSYILLADSLLLRLRGRSLFCGRHRELGLMLPFSVFIWLIFEGYNLELRNWAYVSVPARLWERWSGYTLSFATVLPGIFITADLFDWVLARRAATTASACGSAAPRRGSAISRLLLLTGLIFSVAPFIWPRYLFPAVWLGPIFLLNPLLNRLGRESLTGILFSPERRRVWSLLLGGLFCGALWEFWNFWAGAKWVYSVPFFGNYKVFEMPLLGFLGFPPFALECWILYHLLCTLAGRMNSATGRTALYLAIALFCLIMYLEIDSKTVIRFVHHIHGSYSLWACA
jgi:hypothetical protein